MKKYYFSTLIILFTFLVLPICVFAVTNSGFIPGQIWYSKDVLIQGDTVNIHTAVWNGEKESISAKVEFYDKNVILGSRDITLATLELKDVYIPWKVTAGDHIISAKIISSQQTVSGKKEQVTLGRNATSNDKQFVSVVSKNSKGEPVSGTDAIKNQIEDTSQKIGELIPESVSNTVSNGFTSVENFREETLVQINKTKDETQKELDQMKGVELTVSKSGIKKTSVEDATKKPITYIKIYLFAILSFIFANKIIFYGVLIFIIFLFLRFIYRRIRNR